MTGRWVNFGEEIELTGQQRTVLFPLIAERLAGYLKEDALVDAVARLSPTIPPRRHRARKPDRGAG
jgi:hypothetical protein